MSVTKHTHHVAARKAASKNDVPNPARKLLPYGLQQMFVVVASRSSQTTLGLLTLCVSWAGHPQLRCNVVR